MKVGGKVFLFFLAALLVGAVALMGLAGGRGPDPGAVPTSAEVQDRIMSPFCPGLTVAECPSGQSAELRLTIDAMVASGVTNREIDDWAVANYGEAALSRPRGLLAWLAPAVATLGGLALVLARLKVRQAAPVGKTLGPLSVEQQDRLRRELRSFAEERRE